MTKRNRLIYWITTGLLAFCMLGQAFAQSFQTKGYVDMIVNRLGYPAYFLTILGVWKLLGVIAILLPRFKRVKEWAYAGFFFVMTGAIFSHLASNDPLIDLAPASSLLILLAVSWYFRPADRKLVSINP